MDGFQHRELYRLHGKMAVWCVLLLGTAEELFFSMREIILYMMMAGSAIAVEKISLIKGIAQFNKTYYEVNSPA